MINVACAIIVFEGKMLATQRGAKMKMPFKWEFPGGKVEPDETPEACIIREIKEELSIHIEPVERLKDCFYDYGDFQITLIPFIAHYKSGIIQLAEHFRFNWFSIEELSALDWANADRLVLNELKMRHKAL